MAAHSDSRPSTADHRFSDGPPNTRASWNPYSTEPGDSQTIEQPREREAIPPPPAEPQRWKSDGQTAASAPSPPTNELLETLASLTDKLKDGVSNEAVVDTLRAFARIMQQKVATLGGMSVPPDERTTLRADEQGDRTSLSNSLDGYRPDRDITAPISVRPNAMELLWVCGDCGQHYPRARQCPERCTVCGAPKQHFYAPIED